MDLAILFSVLFFINFLKTFISKKNVKIFCNKYFLNGTSCLISKVIIHLITTDLPNWAELFMRN